MQASAHPWPGREIGIEDTARNRAEAARTVESGEDLDSDDIEELTLDGDFVADRDGDGRVLRRVNPPAKDAAGGAVGSSAALRSQF